MFFIQKYTDSLQYKIYLPIVLKKQVHNKLIHITLKCIFHAFIHFFKITFIIVSHTESTILNLKFSILYNSQDILRMYISF